MPELSSGSAVSRGSFTRRASSIRSDTGFVQLVADMAGALDILRADVAIIKTAVLKLVEDRKHG